MNKTAIMAGAAATVVAGGVAALPYAGVSVPPAILAVGAVIAAGAIVAILTATVFARPVDKKTDKGLLSKQLADVPGLIELFPAGDKAQALSIRPETVVKNIDTALNPGKYTSKEIVANLRSSGPNDLFNPIRLKEIFYALRESPNFAHVILFDSHKDFVGYVPGPIARTAFVGAEGEMNIARLVVDNFDPSKAVYLQLFGGANRREVIASSAKISEAVERMAGGFRQLVVLDGLNPRKPIGLIYATKLIEVLTRSGVPADALKGNIRA